MANVSQLLESRRSRISRWAGAAIVVCGLHVGGAAAVMYWQTPDEEDDPGGALTLDLAPIPAAAPVDSPVLAYGADLREAKENPETSKEVVRKVEKDIPLLEPSPAPQPEVVLPKQQPDKKEQPKEEEAKEAVHDKEKPQDEADEKTSAPPRIEAQPSAAPASGRGASASIEAHRERWKNALSSRLNRFKRVPQAARNRRGEWVTVVTFTLDRAGRLLASQVTESSGLPVLDKEALALLQRASPFPAAPDDVPGLTFESTVSIRFDVR